MVKKLTNSETETYNINVRNFLENEKKKKEKKKKKIEN